MALLLNDLHVVGTTWAPAGLLSMARYAAENGHARAFALAPEPENPHDPFAVGVFYRGHRFGYLPRAVARKVQALMERRGAEGAEVVKITSSTREGLTGFWITAKVS